ncbi:hypothetical protein [Salisediminibacterium beveridgei]|uniref:DUF2628 domain-containing protein n=1 Tax=Salisediminibacterium beveridgei TaxID=632773 RepID=A0A1D7QZJ8_9BACI|nr:hypothetical protein [Salisediminibacterium beveridgei]AOM84433.1 hypothetical protein BBEV_3116 [Salisediminibacterium beveridgei]
MRVDLIDSNGMTKQPKAGFSWTVLIFAFFPPLFRGDLKWSSIIFFSSVMMGFLSGGLLGWVPALVMAFLYNKIYIQKLLRSGFEPADDESREILKEKGVIA